MLENNQQSAGVGAVIKYNPHLWTADELRAIFVARSKELKHIKEHIEKTEIGSIPQHALISGQRGMGKSTLLQRIALMVEEDEKLSKIWLPLRFPEEQYTVRTLADLWINVLSYLADSLEDESKKQKDIDDFIEAIVSKDSLQQEKESLDYLKQWCANYHIGLILLVDSSDLLLSNLSHSGKKKKGNHSDSQLWRLRDVLQTEPCLFWLGGSYQPVDADITYTDTFLDFFYNIELKPLSLKEMKNVIREMAKTFGIGSDLKGEKAVAEIDQLLTNQPARLKVLHRLSGGNLRTTSILYELLSANINNDVQSDLNRLLDAVTPLYKARMESLAEQPRKILAHLFEHWAPISTAQLAQISGLENTSLSPQLQRLELEGLVEKTALPNTTRKGYQITERFFNIWYLMRTSSRRLRLRMNYLITFMKLWFDTQQLTDMAVQQTHRLKNGELSCMGDLEYSRALSLSLPDDNKMKYTMEWSIFRQAQSHMKDQLKDIFDLEGEDKPFATSAEYLERLEVLPNKLRKLPFKVEDQEREEWVDVILSTPFLSLSGRESIASQSHQLNEKTYKELKIKFSDKHLFKSFDVDKKAFNAVKKAVKQGDFFSDIPESQLAYTQIINCFSENTPAFKIALKLFYAVKNDSYVEKATRDLIKLAPFDPEVRYDLAVLLHYYLKKYKEAEETYQQVIQLDEKNSAPWNGIGNLLQCHLNRYDESEEAYRKAIELDEKHASAWYGLGTLLQGHLKRYDESEGAYRKTIELDGERAEYWNALGNLLQGHLKRYNEAEEAYRKAIKLDEKYASAWYGLGALLKGHLKRYDEAEDAYRKAIELDGEGADSWIGLGNLLKNHLKRYNEAEEAYRKAIEFDEKNASAWNGLGNLLQDHLNRYDEAEYTLLKHRDLVPDSPFGAVNLARLYVILDKDADDIKSLYRQAIKNTDTDTDSDSNFNLLLQSHLYLGNQDLALQALEPLAQQADNGGALEFFSIKEQCIECFAIGLGTQLSQLMQSSQFAVFLQPFILALLLAEGDDQSLLAAPIEISDMARDIAAAIKNRNNP